MRLTHTYTHSYMREYMHLLRTKIFVVSEDVKKILEKNALKFALFERINNIILINQWFHLKNFFYLFFYFPES